MAFVGEGIVSSAKKLYKLLTRKQKKAFRTLLLFTFLGSATDLIGLSFTIPIIGLVLSEEYYGLIVTKLSFLSGIEKNNLLLIAVTLFFFVIVAKNMFGLFVNKLHTRFIRDLYNSSSGNVLEKIYRRSLSDIQKTPSAKLVNKLGGMQLGLANHIAMSILIISNESIIFLITSLVLCVWNAKLFALLIGILLPILGIFYARTKKMLKHAGEEKNRGIATLIAKAQEMILGYTDIKIAGTEGYFKKQYLEITAEQGEKQEKTNFINFVPGRILEVAVFLCIIVILVYCVFVLQDNERIITTVSIFSIVAYRSIPSINRLVLAANTLNIHSHILNDSDFVQDEKTLDKQETPLAFDHDIVFHNVSYTYPGTQIPVLQQCNLRIAKGEKIGIIGKSGAGKSTLINNILGFLRPGEGSILIDNQPLTEYNTDAWWKILGYVRQDVFILNGTFAENIALGVPKSERDNVRLQHAIKMASLHDLVLSWPEGIHTLLGENGNKLSGGQKQRIAIARAIYKGASLLIFDEATSSLDAQTEEEITNAIRALGKEELTIIIIAHRFTSLKYCNKIYKLENGQITDTLTYDELAAQVAG